MATWIWAQDRGILRVGGAEAEAFLQGLVSNDVAKAGSNKAVYAALLTPQGKFLHDFFVIRHGDGFLLDCEAERRADLLQRLKRYRLRAKIDLVDETDEWRVALAWGEGCEAATADSGAGAIAYTDPRLSALGKRVLMPAGEASGVQGADEGSYADYHRLRLSLGVPAGPDELQVERSFLMESGFDELAGIDWQKGCYVGQEVTARTKYRGLVRRRLTPVSLSGGEPAADGRISQGGRDVGELRAHRDGVGLAMLKLDALEAEAPLLCGDATLTATRPGWWRIAPATGSSAGSAAAE
tara:strand:- start:1040 stop:1930 length:891 start_codon:yes stop_codon:yes gene_type:complete